MNDKDQIYREELMEIYKNPRNRGSIPDPSVEIEEKNPLCGDTITLQLNITDGKIKDARFDGTACAVTVISSTYLLDELKGKSLEEVKTMTKDDLLELIGINLSTSRVKCATLVLEGIKHAVEKYEKGNVQS
jgi:nitrogen fixation protein NifU and related proteins